MRWQSRVPYHLTRSKLRSIGPENRMKTIDQATWCRRKTYRFYRNLDYPHYNVCADADITGLQHQCERSGTSLFKAVLYGVTLAANAIEEFRCRIRGSEIVVHDRVHPSFTVLTEDNLFSFSEAAFCEDMKAFFRRTDEAISHARENPYLEDDPGRDDFLFISCLPWVRFTSISHPIHMRPVDSVPRISWGKFSAGKDRMAMPLSIQVHHGLADGYHVGQFFNRFQEWADRVEIRQNGE